MEDVVATQRLELRPLSPAAAAALLGDREQAARELRAEIPAEWPDPDLVKLLLKHHADPNLQDKDGRTALMSAISEKHVDVIVPLLDAGS